jgi:hypothetical protein
MLARAHAHCLLAALSAVALLAVATAQNDVALDWELISYPKNDSPEQVGCQYVRCIARRGSQPWRLQTRVVSASPQCACEVQEGLAALPGCEPH